MTIRKLFIFWHSTLNQKCEIESKCIISIWVRSIYSQLAFSNQSLIVVCETWRTRWQWVLLCNVILQRRRTAPLHSKSIATSPLVTARTTILMLSSVLLHTAALLSLLPVVGGAMAKSIAATFPFSALLLREWQKSRSVLCDNTRNRFWL